MNNIPKIAHFYWGGAILPYLRYMSIYSFKKCNPDWKIILHTPKTLVTTRSWDNNSKIIISSEDYYGRVTEFADINIFDMEEIGYSNTLSEVIKSDIIRLYLLHVVGGVWSDTDIIYIKPMCSGIPKEDFVALFCKDYIHRIGFLMGSPGNIHFKKLFLLARQHLNIFEPACVGSEYYEIIDLSSNDVYNMPEDVVCMNHVIGPQMFIKPSSYFLSYITKNTIGWHWFGGYFKSWEYQDLYTENTYNNYDNIVTYLINKIPE